MLRRDELGTGSARRRLDRIISVDAEHAEWLLD
jgi:hypothetical protein